MQNKEIYKRIKDRENSPIKKLPLKTMFNNILFSDVVINKYKKKRQVLTLKEGNLYTKYIRIPSINEIIKIDFRKWNSDITILPLSKMYDKNKKIYDKNILYYLEKQELDNESLENIKWYFINIYSFAKENYKKGELINPTLGFIVNFKSEIINSNNNQANIKEIFNDQVVIKEILFVLKNFENIAKIFSSPYYLIILKNVNKSHRKLQKEIGLKSHSYIEKMKNNLKSVGLIKDNTLNIKEYPLVINSLLKTYNISKI